MSERQPRTVAEAYLTALKSRGVDWIFGNAGTDFAPVIEAIMIPSGEVDLPMWLCHKCGAIHGAKLCEDGLIPNPCPIVGAPAKIFLTIRDDSEPRRIDCMGW